MIVAHIYVTKYSDNITITIKKSIGIRINISINVNMNKIINLNTSNQTFALKIYNINKTIQTPTHTPPLMICTVDSLVLYSTNFDIYRHGQYFQPTRVLINDMCRADVIVFVWLLDASC